MSSPTREVLPVGAAPVLSGKEWSVRLPVRAEEISITKRTVVRERVVVRRQQLEEHARVEARLSREQLRITKDGPVEISERDPESSHVTQPPRPAT